MSFQHKTSSESEEKKQGTRNIRILENGKDVESQAGEADGVYSVGCGNTCRILCCLQPSAIGNSPQMAKITEKIENLDKKVDRIDRRSVIFP